MVNKVFLEGVIIRQPTIEYSTSGDPYCFIVLAIKSKQVPLKNDNDVVPYIPDSIIPLIVWDKFAHYVVAKREIGDIVSVEGKLITTRDKRLMVRCESMKLIQTRHQASVHRKAVSQYYENEREKELRKLVEMESKEE